MTTSDVPWIDLVREAGSALAEAFPNEGCGLVVQSTSGYRFVLCENCLPPKLAPYGYELDPLQIVRLGERGENLVAIAHSHTDGTIRFSEDDIRNALLFAPPHAPRPAYPGIDYLVVGVDAGGTSRAAIHRFDPVSPRLFREVWRTAD